MTTKKNVPVVGVIPLWDDDKESMWMLPGYMDGLREQGCIPVMFPLTDNKEEIEQLMKLVDGVLFTGGHDVEPILYGEDMLKDLVVACPKRDKMEQLVLEFAMKNDLSMLGICRGIQFINACLGGTLYQDLPSQYASEVDHHQKPPYDVPVHEVSLTKGEPLAEYLSKEKLRVNSYHHQAVKELAPGLCEMARSEDGLVEAIYHPKQKFLWALQWHPEFSYKVDEASRGIFKAFAESMKK